MRRKVFVAAVLAVGLLCFACGDIARCTEPGIEGAGHNKFVLTTSLAPGSRMLRAVQYLYSQIFARIGREVELRYIPAIRSAHEANEGFVDGDFFRVGAYELRAPNLVRVREPIAEGYLNLYVARGQLMKINGIADLKPWDGDPLSIGYLRGTLGVEDLDVLFALDPPHSLQGVTGIGRGLQMLVRGRLDVFIGPGLIVDTLITKQEYVLSGVKDAGVIASSNGHIYLHKRHAALVPLLERAIREMKAEGVFPSAKDVMTGKWPDDSLLPPE